MNKRDLANICSCADNKAVTCAAPSDASITTFVTQFTDSCNDGVPPNRKDANDTGKVETRQEITMIITADDIPKPTFDDKHGGDFVDSWPTPSGITKKQAEGECQTQMETSAVYQTCKEQMALHTKTIIESCVSDVQVNTFDIIFNTEILLLNCRA